MKRKVSTSDPPKLRGRPTLFSTEIVEALCVSIAAGGTIKKFCKGATAPSERTIFLWLRDNEQFQKDYVRAREVRADARSERIDDIVTQLLTGKIDFNTARVAIDAEKWQAGKEQPKRYGDKIAAEVTGKDGKAMEMIISPEMLAAMREASLHAATVQPPGAYATGESPGQAGEG